MIEQAPKPQARVLNKAMHISQRPDIQTLINDANDNYLYWSDIKYKKIPSDITKEEFWFAIKFGRMGQRIFTWKRYGISISMTNRMQRQCHNFDMNFGGSWGNNSIIPTEDREQYLISRLMDEAISSSQMEGASTTRKVAKDMLRKNISPRSRSEQMIFNNYVSIRYITEHKNEDLTPELLLHIHSLMTSNTLESADDAGRFRTNNDVVVENSITHEVVHTPPSYTEIPEFIDELCNFANNDNQNVFMHPIVKAVMIHFMLAYVHPFTDGNGRTARALFYWYMLKKGYWLTEYLSISQIIYKSKSSYEKAYLYAEADEGDMGYFLTYHLRVLELAFKELQSYIDRKIKERQHSTNYMLIDGINERQATIISWLRDNPKIVLTSKEIEIRFGISHPTARLDIDGLVGKGLLKRVPVNKVKSNYIKGEEFENIISSIS